MATTAEQQELHKTIWKIANDLRGPIDGWEFKAYVLGSLFYRFISENLTNYINKAQADAGITDFDYAQMSDEEAEGACEMMVQEKGFFILPSQLFQNVVAKAEDDENLNETLAKVFRSIEASAVNSPSEEKVKGLFSDFIVDNVQLGTSVELRNKLMAKVLISVRDMTLYDDLEGNNNDAFGDAYEFLMNMYAANAGKSGGQYFTPQEVSELLASITSMNNPNIKKVYDPTCGSGSLLLKFAKTVGMKNPDLKYYGQEVNPTTYNLCRINMFLHNVNCANFDIQCDDTLLHPRHIEEKFDAIVSNPPYSQPWSGKDDPLLINDVRYSPAGVLAPKSAADLDFTMHMLYHLNDTGVCAIVEFPGVLYRGGAEQKIRKYLIDNNYVDTIIQLPQNLFFGVSIATCIIVLKKGRKADNNVLFIDASEKYEKAGNKNRLTEQDQQDILSAYEKREDVEYFTKLVSNDDIAKNDYNLSVSSYVEQEDKREKINIGKVNYEVSELVSEIASLEEDLDKTIGIDLKGDYQMYLYMRENHPEKFKESFPTQEEWEEFVNEFGE